ncbi:hypothetical protein [Polyangium jinanense]|uniref:Uncharacterized protein n=1 Tax=Polyangium jinanense TaxID=2829994 RepID=A0A9X4AQK6_9BACT|nr:hypothetical protein [Polyangium jinanense]MDC3955042.1 hypothetical protein [Polyangium jinanense]MDC3981188.1 hypothetical protein [Polyangium jinanense]
MSSNSASAPAEVFRRAFVLGLGALVFAAACGGEVPAPKTASRGKHDLLDPAELFPADLDLVLRVDLGRMRAQLGPLADALSARVEEESGGEEALVSQAIARAKVVWIGLRAADAEVGDRVLVVEGEVEDVRPDPRLFRLVDPPIADDVRTWERQGPLGRATTARIHAFAGRMIVFVTPVEVDSVERVLLKGPDDRRRDPAAEGLVSADLRARRLPPSLERRFPSIASIIGGLERARASAVMVGDALRVDAEITAGTGQAAGKAENLLRALREGGQGSRYAALFEDIRIERVDRAVRVRWDLSSEVLRALLEGKLAAPERMQGER